MDERETALLGALGARVRRGRQDRELTLQGLSERSGLSRRFLADVEAGRANISVVKLHRLALALGASAAELLEERRPSAVALLGLRGAGKSTVGSLLADELAVPFVELDGLIEEQSGLPLSEIFAVHGEASTASSRTRPSRASWPAPSRSSSPQEAGSSTRATPTTASSEAA